MFKLTKEQYELFIKVHERHMQAFGTKNQQKYALINVKDIVWDEDEDCLKVYYEDEWWHYTRELEWY
ncbi:hypothetical protein V6E27_28735 [Bacillus cereus]|uniref:hypothetical protein n=1 Tax=Bacillus cereus group TaxID=86661 RepID=UPI000BF6D834|nr:hypothetical protein [Bacillus wiedmannii]PGC57642.1 hypothetical protein COM22_11795 [Bacillus wiedmannii]PHE70861.1 hypothetical protein COF77_24905 [Bacillus wiedmannii]